MPAVHAVEEPLALLGFDPAHVDDADAFGAAAPGVDAQLRAQADLSLDRAEQLGDAIEQVQPPGDRVGAKLAAFRESDVHFAQIAHVRPFGVPHDMLPRSNPGRIVPPVNAGWPEKSYGSTLPFCVANDCRGERGARQCIAKWRVSDGI